MLPKSATASQSPLLTTDASPGSGLKNNPSDFVSNLSRLGFPVVNLDATDAQQDMETLDEWLASSS